MICINGMYIMQCNVMSCNILKSNLVNVMYACVYIYIYIYSYDNITISM